MNELEVRFAKIVEACWSREVFLCVKFVSIEAARSINKFKKISHNISPWMTLYPHVLLLLRKY